MPDTTADAKPTPYFCLLLVAAVFTVIMLNWSLNRGRLVFHPQYDDVQYISEGLTLRDHLYAEGWKGFVTDWKARPHHTPLYRTMAAVGFLLFGTYDWAPYATGGFLIFAMLMFLDRLLLPAPRLVRWGAMVFALFVPLSQLTVTEFRPDVPNGLLTAMAIVLLLGPAYGRRTGGWMGGVCFAAALLMKPPAVPNTVCLVGAATVVGIAAGWVLDREYWTPRHMGRRIGEVLLPAVVLAGWYYVLRFDHVYDYIYRNMFGEHKYLWEARITLKEHLTYYLFGEGTGGGVMLGRQLWVLAAAVVVSIILTLIDRRREWIVRLLAFSVLLVGAYLIPTLAAVKWPFFGTNFQWLLLFSALLPLRGLLCEPVAPWLKRITPWLTGVFLLAAIAMGQFPTPWSTRGVFVDVRNQSVIDVYQEVRRLSNGRKARVVLTTVGYLNKDILDYLAAKDSDTSVTYYSQHMNGDLKLFNKEFDKADIVIAAGLDNLDVSGGFASSAIRDKTLKLIQSREDFTMTRRIISPFGPYYVFAKNTYIPPAP